MNYIKRGSRTTHFVTLPFPLSDLTTYAIHYSQSGQVILTKSMSDCTVQSDNTIAVPITRAESFRFSPNPVSYCVSCTHRLLGDLMGEDMQVSVIDTNVEGGDIP